MASGQPELALVTVKSGSFDFGLFRCRFRNLVKTFFKRLSLVVVASGEILCTYHCMEE